jgi:hypothetical protein
MNKNLLKFSKMEFTCTHGAFVIVTSRGHMWTDYANTTLCHYF